MVSLAGTLTTFIALDRFQDSSSAGVVAFGVADPARYGLTRLFTSMLT